MLLWLYIICIIPFDLSQFDEPNDVGGTANSLEKIAKGYLSSAGLEREAAALLLSRLYMRYVRSIQSLLSWSDLSRKDTGSGFHEFMEWSSSQLAEGDGIFRVCLHMCFTPRTFGLTLSPDSWPPESSLRSRKIWVSGASSSRTCATSIVISDHSRFTLTLEQYHCPQVRVEANIKDWLKAFAG